MDSQTGACGEANWNAAEMGALAHLYRGEMYQSKIWRNRIDATTNWSVVITGIAMSVTFSQVEASAIPVLLVSWVVVGFLVFEARRYLYYDIFRTRVRVMEINFYGPILEGRPIGTGNQWTGLLADDYRHMRFHITFLESIGRRLRRAYGWIFSAHLICYAGKIIVHPNPLDSIEMLWQRAAIGPIPGQAALAFGLAFHFTWIAVAVLTLRRQQAVGLPKRRSGPDELSRVAAPSAS